MFKLQKLALFLLGLLMLNGFASQAYAQTAAAYIAIGRGHLANHTLAELQAADSAFDSALALEPTNQTANVLKATTRLALMVSKPEFISLLSQVGVIVTDSNPYHFTYQIPKDANGHAAIPPGATTDLILSYVNNFLLPEIDGAIANLQKVTATNFLLQLNAAETSMLATNVDYGDVQVALGGLHGVKAVFALANTQNVSASLPVIYDLRMLHERTVESMLEAYPKLLTYTGLDQRAASKSAFQSANAAYQAGSNFIRTVRNAPAGTDFVFSIDASDAPTEERFRRRLAGTSAALNGPTTIDGQSVNLVPLLTTSTQARSLLPQFKGNYVAPNTWPNVTMAGALPGGTQAILNQGAMDAGLLDVAPIVITINTAPTEGIGGFAYASPYYASNPTSSKKLRAGSSVIAFASPAPGYSFVNWTEGSAPVSTSAIYNFTATANRTLVANFTLNPGYYSVTTNPTSQTTSGKVYVSGVFGGQAAGSPVTVAAYPGTGYSFVNWTENGVPVSTSAIYTFTINANRTLVANVALSPGFYSITTSIPIPYPPGSWDYTYGASSGSTTTVNAFTFPGYSFLNWTENGTPVSTSASFTFVVTGNRNLVAHFIPNYPVFAAPSPTPGGSISGVSNGAVSSPILLAPGFGLQVNTASDVTLTATPNIGYDVDQWWLDGSAVQTGGNQYALSNVTATHIIAATFKTNGVQTGSLTVNIAPSGAVSAGAQWRVDGGVWRNSGTTVTDLAVGSHPVEFKSVNGWTEPNSRLETILANQTTTDTGTYSPAAQTGSLQVLVAPSGALLAGGQWQVDGDGIWRASAATVNGLSVGNHTVSFKHINGWQEPSDRTVTIIANQTTSITGTYVITYTVTPGAGVNGSISPSTAQTVVSGGSATFTATPNTNYTMDQWLLDGGVAQSGGGSYTLSNVTANHTLQVTFKLITYTITTGSSPLAGGSTNGGGSKTAGSTMTVIATPNGPYDFVNWTEGGTPVSTTSSYTFTVSANRTLVANFVLSSNANLASLLPSTGILSPVFAPGTLNYTDSVAKSAQRFSLTPTVAHAGATVKVNGITVASGTASSPTIPLIVGVNPAITILVTAPDGITTKTYTVTVTRASRDISRFLNGDLNADLAFQNNVGQIVAWYMNGSGVATSSAYLYTGALGDWKIKGVADMNGDGNTDIVFQNNIGQIAVWYLNGAGAVISGASISNGGLGDWRVMAVADLNNDGNPDLVFQNNLGQIAVWYLNAAGVVTSGASISNSALGDWRVQGVADINGDGNADLLFQNSPGSIAVWYLNGSGGVTGSYLFSGATGDFRIAATADLNGDGNADLVFQNNAGSIAVWYLNVSGTVISSGYLYSGGLGDWRLH